MRKIFAVVAIAVMLLSLSACHETEERAAPCGNSVLRLEGVQTYTASLAGGLPQGQNILVAYFSATGTTRMAAERIAGILNATLHGILPRIPYTPEDLDWRNRASRSIVEQHDASARPAILGTVENMGGYGVVFLGYPIWSGIAPRVIYTFLESHDFSGKTIVPFSTSNTSGNSRSVAEIRGLLPDSNVLSGFNITRANLSRMDELIEEWLNRLMVAD